MRPKTSTGGPCKVFICGPSVWNHSVGDTLMPAGKGWLTLGPCNIGVGSTQASHSASVMALPSGLPRDGYRLTPVLGRLLHNDPPVGGLTGANHDAAMVLVEGNALESPRGLRAMPDDRRIVAERQECVAHSLLSGDSDFPRFRRRCGGSGSILPAGDYPADGASLEPPRLTISSGPSTP
jgi:hypothetical protein